MDADADEEGVLIGRGGRTGLRRGMEDVVDLWGCVCSEVRSWGGGAMPE